MVQVDGLDRLLREHPFFREFDAEALALMAGCARNERFEAGQVILRAGDAADRFYILRHGDVAVEVAIPGRGRRPLETLHAGDILGWSWLVPPYRLTFDARALTLVRAISLDAACLRAKMEENHEMGYRLLQRFVPVMAERLTAARLQLQDLYGPSAAPVL
ncbi:cyclic nucleotide-binding domain-containing protein [Azospirillum halopraeferens]|uniref:cyclic nucleotide-binding domain-containing protein n=1 Tax=Azospirillum halopraeferens TaxID=34010 RepID=UPI00040D6389|nr:cyclic nucleotide-binding domain-containing protein [Azospirillum halopraeferens]